MKLQIFLFNWPGQTDKAKITEKKLCNQGYSVTVINSDPDYTPFNWINLGNSAYFGQQWRLALGLFNADIMFHIQADVTYDDWGSLIGDALRYHEKYNWGIYSPKFQEPGWYPPLDTWHCEDENIRAVPNPDCTCWFLDRTVIDDFRRLGLDLAANHYGWGIDSVASALSWMSGRIVLQDFAHEAFHAPGRGYSSQDATDYMNRMFQTLSPEINHAITKQYADRESLLQYLPQPVNTSLDHVKYFAEKNQYDLTCFHAQKLMLAPDVDPGTWAEAAQLLSINAFYTTTYNKSGKTMCEYLATSSTVPDHVRHLARNNNVYYAQPLTDMAPSWQAQSLEFATQEGWLPMNPSVCSYQDKIYMIQRTVNYVVDKQGSYITYIPQGYADTQNYFVELDHNLNMVSRMPILHPENHPEPAWPMVQGFEDSRLFFWQGEPWCSSTVRDQNPQGLAQIALTRLVKYSDHYQLADYRAIKPDFCPETYEKNWMPVVCDNELRWIYSSDPVRVVDSQGHLICEHTVDRAVDNFRGGYVIGDFDQGYLAVIHESSIHGTLRKYLHRFAWYDQSFRLQKYSDVFYLTNLGLEFVAGVTRHPVTKDVILSYGVGDSTSWLGTITEPDVMCLLKYNL
ncbi:hypothetical protein UFOVP29_144 [uncultured Caudovirales phage]|uniref:Uncharacterized protein n=1 Tax=uncultured Caudovirales phage TaxID=2100421 RepID=A0A6J5KNP8_9CAUD|nr:hypothetical protein UFOVP29_144 [uncultured Caudovirales phage]